MKKKVALLFILLLTATGCNIARIDNNNINENLDLLLNQKNKIYNVNFEGYKYYVPTGLKFLNKEEYNAILEDKYKVKYYLYVDAISYYHKIDINHTTKLSLYYDENINYNKKDGYLKIEEVEDYYHVEFVYNYAKIEAYVDEEHLNNTIINMCYILRSIKYNDKVLDSLIGDNVLSYQEETFSLFDAEPSQEDFLEVVSKYDAEYSKVYDQDNINIDDDVEEVNP